MWVTSLTDSEGSFIISIYYFYLLFLFINEKKQIIGRLNLLFNSDLNLKILILYKNLKFYLVSVYLILEKLKILQVLL